MTPSPRLQAAIDAAQAAADLIRKGYRSQFDVQIKADASPVTEVDIACEHRIREILDAACPGYGFFGEETGRSDSDSEFMWLVDPLDGTKSFVRGYPFISTQIALMQGEELVLGVSCAPLFDELACAEKGQGAWLNGESLQVSDVNEWSQATLSTGNIAGLAQQPARWQALGTLLPKLHRIRGYGDFYHYHLLSAGRIDAVLESDLNILDIAANTVILREAGGVITDLDGGPIGLQTTSTVAGNAHLQPRLLELMHAP
nr:inositol monophosphatase [Oceanococcus sp. HetDA_MAG_MS8]